MTGLEMKEGFVNRTETVVFATTFQCVHVKPGSLGTRPSGADCMLIFPSAKIRGGKQERRLYNKDRQA
jgi:hypothetical protein